MVERQDNEEPTFELAVIGLVLATVTGFIFFAGKNSRRIFIEEIRQLWSSFIILQNHSIRLGPYALSFNRSQNVLSQSKFFEPAQKFDYI